jgi:hypothetical protein
MICFLFVAFENQYEESRRLFWIAHHMQTQTLFNLCKCEFQKKRKFFLFSIVIFIRK